MRVHCEKCSGSGCVGWPWWAKKCDRCHGKGAEPPPSRELQAADIRECIRESERISCFSGVNGLLRIRLLIAIDRARARLRQIERPPIPPPPPPYTTVSGTIDFVSAGDWSNVRGRE